ncbi:branched-chain amino acid ABC transporter ATP-binding protein/permease [Mesorhizobium sp.]|uniref:branched-chain amino acid ABC transporter ATP-binding protein/permease n=1 Tax=Mesorhizobium sp. TaxID=1871066 RepID=UPI0016727959|nr:branched-chain amino acid ABC transporter ATP-binding protein/permease [Mesorhizobium sp.]
MDKALQVIATPRFLLNVTILGVFLILVGTAVALFGTSASKLTYVNALVSLIAVLGLTVYSGNSGILSFGHVGFMALGAQISASLTIPPALKASALPLLPSFIQQSQFGLLSATVMTLVIVGIVAAVVAIPIAKLGGASGAIGTLGFLIIVNSLIVGAQGITRGSQAMYGIAPLASVGVATALALCALFVARAYRDAIAGLLLRSSREDEAAAYAIGVDVVRQRQLAFIVSAIITALAGVVLAHSLTVFSAKVFYLEMTFSLIVMYVVGGAGSVTGAVVGVTVVTLLVEILRRLEPGVTIGPIHLPQIFGLTVVGLSVAILVILLVRRQGLVGHAEVEDLFLSRRLRNQGMGALPSDKPEPSSLSARELSKSYGGVRALDGVTLTLASGQVLGLIGPNGSGKTTLLGCLAGTLVPSGGTIVLAGQDISGYSSFRIARLGVGRTFQTVRLFGRLTVLENVKAALAQKFADLGHAELERMAVGLLEALGIADMQNRPANELAYGLQRRLEIARALATNPRFMLLDEPAAGMNEGETRELLATLRKVVRERGIGLLIVDHDMALIMELCDRVAVLNKGQLIAEGEPDAVWADPAVREAYIGRRSAKKDWNIQDKGVGNKEESNA